MRLVMYCKDKLYFYSLNSNDQSKAHLFDCQFAKGLFHSYEQGVSHQRAHITLPWAVINLDRIDFITDKLYAAGKTNLYILHYSGYCIYYSSCRNNKKFRQAGVQAVERARQNRISVIIQ
jgi:hypothetical protein